MRTSSDGVTDKIKEAALAQHRRPVAKAIVRAASLRWPTGYAVNVDPDGDFPLVNDGNPVKEEDGYSHELCQMDADHDRTGRIMQAAVYDQTTLRFRYASDGSFPAAWANSSLGARSYCVPGVRWGGDGYFYLYYVNASGQIASAKYSTLSGFQSNSAWTTSVSLGSGVAGVAPTTATDVFVCYSAEDHIEFKHVANDGTITDCPRRLYGTSSYLIGANEHSTVDFFDAFTFDGVTHYVVFTHGRQKLGWVMTYRAGTWGDPRPILPPDYSGFLPYRVTVLPTFDAYGVKSGQTAFLTGRLYRDNADGFDQELDVLLKSVDGLNWTYLTRDAFLSDFPVRGKLLLAGNTAYYAGMYHVQETQACYDLGVDNPSLKETVTDALLSAEASFPGTNSAPTLNLTLGNGANTFRVSGLARPASDVWLHAGYYNGATPEYARLIRANIESVTRSAANGALTFDVQALDAQLKKLSTWNSPFYVDMRSQTKHRDDCDQVDQLFSGSTPWKTLSARNQGPANSGFEKVEDGVPEDWSLYAEPEVGADGSMEHRNNTDHILGTDETLGSCYIHKFTFDTPTENDRYGLKLATDFSAAYGVYYTVTIAVRATFMPAPAVITLEATGSWKDNLLAQTVSESISTSGDWSTLTVNFKNERASQEPVSVAVRVFAQGSGAVDFGVDNFYISGGTTNYLSYAERDVDAIMFSTDPYESRDFDIRGRFYDDVAAKYAGLMPNRVGFGLVGCAADQDNLIVLKVGINPDADPNYANVRLEKRRRGVFSLLGSSLLGSVKTLAVKPNTYYWVRLTHRGGLFSAWVKEDDGTGIDWGEPLFTYQWAETNDVPCPTESGAGKVGVWGKIDPYKFHIFGTDPHSIQLALRYDNDGDWSDFPDYGDVIVDEEIMSINTRQNEFLHGPTDMSDQRFQQVALSADLTAEATSLVLSGPVFNSAGWGGSPPTGLAWNPVYLYVTDGVNFEIIKLPAGGDPTTHTGITRGYAGSTAHAFAAGSACYPHYAVGFQGDADYSQGDFSEGWSTPLTPSAALPLMTGDGYYRSDLPPENGIENRWKCWTAPGGYVCSLTRLLTTSVRGYDDLKNYALVVQSGLAAGHSWYIHGNEASAGGQTHVWCDRGGHEAEWWEEKAHDEMGVFPVNLIDGAVGGESGIAAGWGGSDDNICVARLAPCLRVDRGVTGKRIVQHADNSICMFYTDDTLRLHEFRAFDFEHDNCTEDLLRRIAAAAGVLEVEFGRVATQTGFTLSASPGANGFYVLQEAFPDPAHPVNLSRRDFELRFDLDDGAGELNKMLLFHADAAGAGFSDAHVLRFYDGKISLEECLAGVVTLVESETISLTGTVNYRVVVNEGFVTVYANGRVALNAYVSNLQEAESVRNHYIFFAVWDTAQAATVANLRLPELHDWRDAVYVDNDADASAALSTVIGERFIRFLSRSGERLAFSAFDEHPLAGPETYSETVYSDQVVPEEAEIATYLRVYAAEVMEMWDPALMRKYGFIFRSQQMPKASNTLAKAMAERFFRRIRENKERHQLALAADFRLEPEDQFVLDYFTPGIQARPDSVNAAETALALVINDIAFSFAAEPVRFEASIGARRLYDATVD